MESEGRVVGHYVQGGAGPPHAGPCWVPALQQSTELFKAVVADDITTVEALIGEGVAAPLGWHTVLYWSGNGSGDEAGSPQVQAKTRSLAQIATQHGSLRVLSALLAKGANPRAAREDGLSCYEFVDSGNPNAPTIRAMLDDAAGNFAAGGEAGPAGGPQGGAGQRPGSPDAAPAGPRQQQQAAQQEQDQPDLDGVPYSTTDLTRPEYSTDTFRMFCFKVLRCSKRYAHDWRACPFAHPTENARRRDPREFRYSSLVCPDYRQGCCVRGDTCQYAHGVFESWLHPSRYRTQLCKDGDKCDRPVCFFAHSIEELRTPVDSFVPNPDERLRVPEAMQVVLGMASPASLSSGGGRADTAYAADQNSGPAAAADHLLSPVQRGASSSSGGGGGGAGACGEGLAASSSYGSNLDQGAAAAPAGAGAPSPNKQLVSPGAVPVPRMSNAFARKHGLDPKDNPLVNLQRLAMQQVAVAPQQSPTGGNGGSRRQRRGGRAAQSPSPQPLLQPPQLLQQQQQLMQAPPSPASYYAAAGQAGVAVMQPSAQAPPPLLDPQAMALLFGGMSIGGPPLSPAAAAAAMAAAGGGMPGAQLHAQLAPVGPPYGLGGPAAQVGMAGMLGGSGLGPAALGPPSPLGPPGMAHGGMAGAPPPPF